MKQRNVVLKYGRTAGAAVLSTGSGLALATGGAYDTISAVAVWTDAITAITAIGVALGGVFVIRRGVRVVLKMIG